VFEAGLFGGALGIRRTFILHAHGSKLPSDLLGLTSVRYDPATSGGRFARSIRSSATPSRPRAEPFQLFAVGCGRVVLAGGGPRFGPNSPINVRWRVRGLSGPQRRMVERLMRTRHVLAFGGAFVGVARS
jgi:hypothetical protein